MRFLVLAAAGVLLLAPPAANASTVGVESGVLVVRFEDGEPIQEYNSTYGPSFPYEVKVDAAAGTVTASHDGPIVIQTEEHWPGRRPVTAGLGCTAVTRGKVSCPLAAVSAIRVEFGNAAGPGVTPAGRVLVEGTVGVLAGALGVTVIGGPNANVARVMTTGALNADMGGGDDVLTSRDAPAGAVAGGPGNDQLEVWTRKPSSATFTVSGGPGDDVITSDDAVPFDSQGLSPQRVDCGDGADVVNADRRDVVGAGCAPAPRGLPSSTTIGRFDADGMLLMPPVRISSRATLTYELSGPKPPSFKVNPNSITAAYGVRRIARITGSLRRGVSIRPRPPVRSALRRRRAPVTGVTLGIESRARGGAADKTRLGVIGTLRRR